MMSDAATAGQAIIQKDRLADYLDAVGALVNEAKVHADADGLTIRAVDPANVGMVEATLDAATGSSAFESYAFDGVTLGVNVNRLQEYLSIADSGDLVLLDLATETRSLHIEIGGFEATQALIDPDAIRQEPDIPDLDLAAEVVVEGRWLADAADAADIVSDHVRFGADPGNRSFWMAAQGDTDDIEWALSDEEVIDARVGEPAESGFSLDYVTDMVGPIPADAAVEVRVGQEFPMHWSFPVADGFGTVEYTLAPRLKND